MDKDIGHSTRLWWAFSTYLRIQTGRASHNEFALSWSCNNIDQWEGMHTTQRLSVYYMLAHSVESA